MKEYFCIVNESALKLETIQKVHSFTGDIRRLFCCPLLSFINTLAEVLFLLYLIVFIIIIFLFFRV